MNKFPRLLINLIPVFIFLAIVYSSVGSSSIFNATQINFFDNPSSSNIMGFGSAEQNILCIAFLFLLFLMFRSATEKSRPALK